MSSKKKGSGPTVESTYEIKDIVLAKVKGHPAWPARVIEPTTAPDNLHDQKKMAQKNAYLVKFFYTGDYAWMNARELSRLEKHEIQSFVDNPHKKGADLKLAYQIALDPTEWEEEQIKKAEQAKRDAEEYAAKLKAKEEDELDEDGDGTGKKRKRKSEAKPKEAKKRKADAESKKKGKKGKEEVSDDGGVIVKNWRHKLQRIFLGKTEATADSMPDVDQTFKDIEAFEMKIEWLQETKLGKVLKRIGALPDEGIPDNDKYGIRQRAKKLQIKWASEFNMNDDKAAVTAAEDGPADAAAIPHKSPAANGDAEVKDAEGEAEANVHAGGEKAAEVEEGEDQMDLDETPISNGNGQADEASAPNGTADTEV